MNFISAHLLRIFYSWSKHNKRICTVRQYSGSLAHQRGMCYNGKEGKEGGKSLTHCIESESGNIEHTSLIFLLICHLKNGIKAHPTINSAAPTIPNTSKTMFKTFMMLPRQRELQKRLLMTRIVSLTKPRK